MSVARFVLSAFVFLGLDLCTHALGSTGSLRRREGNLEDSQTVSSPSAVWRAFACMPLFTASDNTPLLMLYGGTTKTGAKDPLSVAANGVTGLQVFDLNNNKWYAPSTANAPKTGPVLPGCGAAAGNIWVHSSQYGMPGKASTAVSLLDSVHWSWSSPTEQGQLPVTRFGAAYAYASTSQSFYMHGGVPLNDLTNTADNPPGIANNMDILQPSGLTWDYASNGPARKYHTLCYMSLIDSLVLFGGSDQNIASYNDVKTFSVKSSIWQYSVNVEGTAPAERVLHSAVCTADSMYVFGGLHSINDDPSDSAVWVLKANGPTNFTWSKAPVVASAQGMGPTARAGHSAALHGNNMYIFGGVGPSGQDGAMYRLDLDKWQWTTTTADQDDSSGGSNGAKTRVLVAAIVSSVLGVICIGVAAFVFYRWNRRRAVAVLSPIPVSSPDDTDDSANIEIRKRTNTAMPIMGGVVPYATANAQMNYSQQYENHPGFLFIASSDSTAVHRRASNIVANNYMPSPHANPSLGSSIGTFSPPMSPIAAHDSPSNSISRMPNSLNETPLSGNIGASLPVSPTTQAHPHSPNEVISSILSSGQPIPAWLREAAQRGSGELSGSSTPVNQPAASEFGPETRTVPTLAVANAAMDRSSYIPTEAGLKRSGCLTALEPGRYDSRLLDISSANSDATNDTQAAPHYEPIQYMDRTQASTDPATGATHGSSAVPRTGRKVRRRESDISDISFALGPNTTQPLRWPGMGSIAQPMLPPVPPHMNSLYGGLESNGIRVGQVSTSITCEPAYIATTSSHAQGSADDDGILSPLDRLARYHNLDAWMTSPPEREPTPSQASMSATTDGTSNIYSALPVRRSTDSF
ncbi:hypothetical protein FBU31_001755 [Coemansia sp. 'formosensis']|nr:hypothetical protein FBU31_001755 [Coemansia sp. 'formosensis']